MAARAEHVAHQLEERRLLQKGLLQPGQHLHDRPQRPRAAHPLSSKLNPKSLREVILLSEIVAPPVALRDEHMPGAQIALLSNSHNVTDSGVRRVIGLFDQRCMKLDAGEERLWKRINVPFGVTLDQVVEGLCQLEDITIQTMVIRGRADNSGDEATEALVEKLRVIRPAQIHLYTLDRAAALEGVEAVPLERLEAIAGRLREGVGVPVEVFG